MGRAPAVWSVPASVWWVGALLVGFLLTFGGGGLGGRQALASEPLVLGLDHVVVAVADLDSATATFRRLGFEVKEGRVHDGGIANRHVKFPDGTEIELMSVTEPRSALAMEYARAISGGDGAVFASLFAPSLVGVEERLTGAGFGEDRDDLRLGESRLLHRNLLASSMPERSTYRRSSIWVSLRMDVDYGQMVRRADRLLGALDGAVSLHITAPGGSDFRLDVTGRRFITDVRITEEERGANLPCGEVYGAPVEDGAEGVVVVEGAIGGEGPPPSPVRLELNAGRVETVHCASEAWQRRITELLDTDDGAGVIAELGIGLNPGARLVGFMLEDEKAYRTIHVAFGSNIGMPGGANESATYVDYLVTRPTMTARFADGRERMILEDGDICVSSGGE